MLSTNVVIANAASPSGPGSAVVAAGGLTWTASRARVPAVGSCAAGRGMAI
jgi:hypothetical protein